MSDWELLQNYAIRGSEAAFRTLVDRYVNLVHSVAMRHVQDRQLAEDVSQAVFILLARKAGSLKKGIAVGGWLFQTTRFVAARACRAEQRRRRREQEAYDMQQLTTADETWRRISPALDGALAQLAATDRNLLLLRYYEGKNHNEAGAALGLSEEAARKRGWRALEKLRVWFTKRGVIVSATGLAGAISANAIQAAPWGLAGGILATTAKVTEAAALPTLVRETLAAWRWMKVKVASALLVPAAAAIAVALAMHGSKTLRGSNDGAVNVESSARVINLKPQDQQTAAGTVKRPESVATNLQLRVVAKDTGKPVARTKLVVVKVPNGEPAYDLTTDENGVCNIALPAGLERLDVGVFSPGWGSRYATWTPTLDDTVPSEYTLRVESATNSVAGWLQDEAGKPVEGAMVWIQFREIGDYSWRETPRERAGIMLPLPAAKSDREGHWSCAIIPPDNRGFQLEARHPDFPTTIIASSSPETDEESLGIKKLWAGTLITTLSHAQALRGTVLSDTGARIAGARIDYIRMAVGTQSLITDTNGTFAILKLDFGEFEFTVSADGYAPKACKVQLEQQTTPIQIVLDRGALLKLRVADGAGNAVPEAKVQVEHWGELRDVNWSAQSGPDGRVEWRSAPDGVGLLLSARKDGWCSTRHVECTADGTEHTITMIPALTLSGHVTDAEGGAPLEDFKVVPGYGEGRGDQVWERSSTRRGTKGEFKLLFEESTQPWRVRVEADGYQPAISGPVAVDFSGVQEISLKRADPRTAVRGVVLQPNGTPAAGVSVALLTLDYGVQLHPPIFRDERVGTLTNTDATGNFVFAVNPRAHSVAAVSAAGYARLRVKNSTEPVTVKLQPWSRIEGDLAGKARQGSLEAVTLMDDTALSCPGSVSLDCNVKPDLTGHFVFERVPAGRFSLYLNRAMGIPLSQRTEIEIRPGQTTTVTIGNSGRDVVGRLSSENVRPGQWGRQDSIASLAIKFESPPFPANLSDDSTGEQAGLWAVDFWQSQAGFDYYHRNPGYGLTIATNGTFRAEGVAPGTYQLSVRVGNAWLNQEVTVPDANAAGAEDVDLGAFQLSTKGASDDGEGR